MQRIRWPKNFSLFSGSDSESEGQAPQPRSKPHLHLDLSKESASQQAGKGHGSSTVKGVYLFCAGDQIDLSALQTPLSPTTSFYSPEMGVATVAQSDAVFSGTPLAVSQLIGIPLLMRPLAAKQSPSSPHFENPLASHLQIDPANQLPSPRGIGTVLVVRADKEPLEKDLLVHICAFHNQLLTMAQQRGPGSMSELTKTWATPENFKRFCKEFRPTGTSGNVSMAGSVHMLGGSWHELQRPMAAV
ncbi:hypothetical protein CPB86DRAFT_35099 [Serendipita vermifera]|nr:hypothetical protein CPB86DRAFT_35099 [Serendipita vermifera]